MKWVCTNCDWSGERAQMNRGMELECKDCGAVIDDRVRVLLDAIRDGRVDEIDTHESK